VRRGREGGPGGLSLSCALIGRAARCFLSARPFHTLKLQHILHHPTHTRSSHLCPPLAAQTSLAALPLRARSAVPVPPELELVETDDQITHEVTLEDKLEPQVGCWWRGLEGPGGVTAACGAGNGLSVCGTSGSQACWEGRLSSS
jgi:hypothetical protein